MNRFVLYLLIGISTALFIGWYFSEITFYFIFSIVIAAVLRPITNRIAAIHILGRHIPRWLSILFSFASVCTVIFLIVLLFLPLISTQIELLSSYDIEYVYEQIKKPLGNLETVLINYKIINQPPGYLFDQISDSFNSSISAVNIQKTINAVFDITSSFFIGFMAILFISFFLLLENGLLRRNIIRLIPNAYFELSIATFQKVERLLSNYLIGLLFQMTMIFTLASVGLTLAGVEYALTIAFFAAIANLIPYAGPILGATFGILVGLSTGIYTDSAELVILIIKILSVFSVVQATDNILFQPLIFSKSVKAHPLEIFVIIFAGAKIAGVLGMIFAIPVYTIFRVATIEFYKGYKEFKIFKL
jgi:predicted PurR-regulated permease PerM